MSGAVVSKRVPARRGRGPIVPEPTLAAVLFDMDGTLVDSEKLWELALQELAASYGGVLSDDARARMVGTSTEESMHILHAELDQPWRDAAASGDWLDRRVFELFAGGLQWRPGARDLLAAVRAAGLPTALVTSTRRRLVDVVLDTLGRDNFDVVVCGDEVSRAKPDPTPYLQAASALGVDPRACVAVEDSPTGVASARAAGCAVVAVPNDVALSDVDGYLVVSSLGEVDLTLLRDLAGRRRPRADRA
jgi:HAD superfamily hydrolase (TIGR01509 family)